MAEEKQEDSVVEEPKVDETEQAQEDKQKAKPGRKPQLRKSAKSEDEADQEKPEEDVAREGKTRVVKEGDDIEVATEIVNGQKVATETVLQEFTPINSKRVQRRLVASAGTIVK